MQSDIGIDSKLTDLKGIGPKRAEALGRMGLFSVRDLLYFAPREHLDLRETKNIRDLKDGEYAIVRVDRMDQPKMAYVPVHGRKTSLVTVRISDETDDLRLSWFNQPYIRRNLPNYIGGYVHGRIDLSHGKAMRDPQFSPAVPGMLPVYPLTKSLGQNAMRSTVKTALHAVRGCFADSLPDDIRIDHGLCQLDYALENLHFPICPESLSAAKRRLAFESALYFTILLESIRRKNAGTSGISFRTAGSVEEFVSLLPFKPTSGQLQIMREISRDMASPAPMNRLVQGDVGSGKTIIAFYAMYAAVKNGYQAALMAPTAMLAEQHYRLLNAFFGPEAAILTSGMKKSEQKAILDSIASGEVKYVAGTHSLLESSVNFNKLGIVITDEQHRFGVRQRAVLGSKAACPDTLIMSATPIPRTLSLILYGDVDVSRLKEMPHGRRPVLTRYVPSVKRLDMYRYIAEQIKQRGIQAYVVCPMIEDNEDMPSVFSAEAVYDELEMLSGIDRALIHGRMKPAARDEIMRSFRDGKTDLLVATTVIEVGVDVPNACIMVIESAERFGLAQLHQLRGRVGRSDKQSMCFLLSENDSASAAQRLSVLISTNDGFEIAEKDLEQRGPGEFLGQRQHGSSNFMSSLALTDMDTLIKAREAAEKMMESRDPEHRQTVADTLKRYSDLLENVAIN